MKMIRGTLKLVLILYICAALSGIYVLSASARITPHDGDDEKTTLITIKKGDTLWDLCQEHLEDPLRWRELSKYNDFTNPDLIYPGETLRIPLLMLKEVVEELEVEVEEQVSTLADAEEIADMLAKLQQDLEKQIMSLKQDLAQQETEETEELDKKLGVIQEETDKKLGVIQEETDKKLGVIQDQIEKRSDETKQKVESVTTELKAVEKQIAGVQEDVKQLLTQIETNQKAIKEARMILKDAEGIHEEVSTSKRTVAFLTAAAAGIGWFIMNTIGGRSGE